MGDFRALENAPLHLTETHSWTWDQLEISDAQADDESLLVTMVCLIVACGWDGWLLTSSTADAVEFWEGNVLFYSENEKAISEARRLLGEFEAPPGLA